MKFSLILATINRNVEVKKLLKSLASQTFTDFELIIVDQNKDKTLNKELYETYKSIFNLKVIYAKPGLSKARNIGIRHAAGQILAFPDDDCEYPPKILEQVANEITNYNLDGVSVKVIDRDSRTPVAGKPSNIRKTISRVSVWDLCCSAGLFIKSSVFDNLKPFNELLGVGANSPWQSGEETELMIRIIDNNFKVEFVPDLEIYHPLKVASYNSQEINRALIYGRGMGKVLRITNYYPFYTLYKILKPLIGTIIFLPNRAKSLYYYNSFKGRLTGYLSKKL